MRCHGDRFRRENPTGPTFFIAVYEWIVYDYLSTLHIETKRHFVDSFIRHRVANGLLIAPIRSKAAESHLRLRQ